MFRVFLSLWQILYYSCYFPDSRLQTVKLYLSERHIRTASYVLDTADSSTFYFYQEIWITSKLNGPFYTKTFLSNENLVDYDFP